MPRLASNTRGWDPPSGPAEGIHAHTLMLDFWPSEPREYISVLYDPDCRSFVVTAPGNEYRGSEPKSASDFLE